MGELVDLAIAVTLWALPFAIVFVLEERRARRDRARRTAQQERDRAAGRTPLIWENDPPKDEEVPW